LYRARMVMNSDEQMFEPYDVKFEEIREISVQEQKELEKESDENKCRAMTMNIFNL
jgi:hypothetical protein